MTNDKALEAAYAVAGNACKTCQGGDTCNGFECRIAFEAAISAYLSALPGEAEVVGWLRMNPSGTQSTGITDTTFYRDLWARDGSRIEPLVTLASLQAMQARAEKAERERDEAVGKGERQWAGWVKEEVARKAAEASVKELEEALNLFREFVLRNATQWKLGAGHHHPMWQLVAELLHGAPEIQNGPEWQFIWPENKKPLEDLRTALKGGSNG